MQKPNDKEQSQMVITWLYRDLSFLLGFQFPPTTHKHGSRLINKDKLHLGVNKRVKVYDNLDWDPGCIPTSCPGFLGQAHIHLGG